MESLDSITGHCGCRGRPYCRLLQVLAAKRPGDGRVRAEYSKKAVPHRIGVAMSPNDSPPPSESFIATLKRIRVQVRSPDRSVTGSYSHQDGVTIRIDPDALPGHDETSLAAQLSAALNSIHDGYREAIDTVRRRRAGDDAPAVQKARKDERRRRNFEAVSAVSARGVSPQGFVTVGIQGSGEHRVRLRPRTLDSQRLGVDALDAEINTAVRRARSDMVARLRHAEEHSTTGKGPVA